VFTAVLKVANALGVTGEALAGCADVAAGSIRRQLNKPRSRKQR
jgi:hypothetical protein